MLLKDMEWTDNELKALVRSGNIGVWLDKVKHDKSVPARYWRQMENYDKNSKVVRVILPQIVVNLLHANIWSFESLMEDEMVILRDNFVKMIDELFGEEMTPERFAHMSDEEIADTLYQYEKKGGHNSSNPLLLQIQFKLNGVDFSDERRDQVKELIAALEKADAKKEMTKSSKESKKKKKKKKEARENAARVEPLPSAEQKKEEPAPERRQESDSEPEPGPVPEVRPETKPELKPDQEPGAEAELNLEREAEASLHPEHETATPELKSEPDPEMEGMLHPEHETVTPDQRSEAEPDQEILPEPEAKPPYIPITYDRKLAARRIFPLGDRAEGVSAAAVKENTYIGFISIRSNFYNFEPVGVLTRNGISMLRTKEVEKLMPKSQFHNLNLSYNFYDETSSRYMKDRLYQNEVMVLRFTLDDLEENIDSNGVLNGTGYRMSAQSAFGSQALRFASDYGWYRLLPSYVLMGKIREDSVIYLDPDAGVPFAEGEKVLVKVDRDFLAGPYKILHSNSSDRYLIKTQVKENHYVLSGFTQNNIVRERIAQDPDRQDPYNDFDPVNMIGVRDAKSAVASDVLTDDMLMENIKEMMAGDNADALIRRSTEELAAEDAFSSILGKSLMPQIEEARINRVKAIFSEKEKTERFAGEIADIIFQMITQEKDSDRTKNLMKAFADHYDVFLPGNREKESQKVKSPRITRRQMAMHMRPADLATYLVRTVQQVRPNYTRNDILNLFICMTQGFLTVISGEPGCGKTSICNIMAKSLGLAGSRYVPVSVERGWTSKRDLIGYYNPLTRSFEENNREVFDALKELDEESREEKSHMPYLILLDEANLSPMEYYWADFMNVCDDIADNHSINLGNDHVFEIPETLHFLATINNDHTTETLSPRLIDRAWIITLPHTENIRYTNETLSSSLDQVSWEDLKRAFGPDGRNVDAFDGPIEKLYRSLLDSLRQENVTVSPRTDIAIHRYVKTAASYMERDENGRDPRVIALDFAFMQKILPRMQGSGEEYEDFLTGLCDSCRKGGLIGTAAMLDAMVLRGNKLMKYYQFF